MRGGNNMQVETLVVGPIEANCYLVYDDNKEAVIIDPGAEPEKIIKWIQHLQLKPKFILNTHGHYDHVGGNDLVRQALDIPVYIAAPDAKMLDGKHNFFGTIVENKVADHLLEDGDRLPFSNGEIEVVFTPGHTKGSCVFYFAKEKISFTGDTVFKGTVGRTDLPGGDFEEILNSVQYKLKHIENDVVIYPGHGPKTTFQAERIHNPYFRWK